MPAGSGRSTRIPVMRVGVELADHGQDIGDLGVVREMLLVRVLTSTLREPPHVALVRSGGMIVAHEDRGRARAGDAELPELLVDVLGELLGERVPVDRPSLPCHVLPSNDYRPSRRRSSCSSTISMPSLTA